MENVVSNKYAKYPYNLGVDRAQAFLYSPLTQIATASPNWLPAIWQTKVCQVLSCANELDKDPDSTYTDPHSSEKDFMYVLDDAASVPVIKARLALFPNPHFPSLSLSLSGVVFPHYMHNSFTITFPFFPIPSESKPISHCALCIVP